VSLQWWAREESGRRTCASSCGDSHKTRKAAVRGVPTENSALLDSTALTLLARRLASEAAGAAEMACPGSLVRLLCESPCVVHRAAACPRSEWVSVPPPPIRPLCPVPSDGPCSGAERYWPGRYVVATAKGLFPGSRPHLWRDSKPMDRRAGPMFGLPNALHRIQSLQMPRDPGAPGRGAMRSRAPKASRGEVSDRKALT